MTYTDNSKEKDAFKRLFSLVNVKFFAKNVRCKVKGYFTGSLQLGDYDLENSKHSKCSHTCDFSVKETLPLTIENACWGASQTLYLYERTIAYGKQNKTDYHAAGSFGVREKTD